MQGDVVLPAFEMDCRDWLVVTPDEAGIPEEVGGAPLLAVLSTAVIDREDLASASAVLTVGLLDDDQKAKAGDRLADVVASRDYKISTGFAGTPFLTWALSDTGHIEDAYRLLLQESQNRKVIVSDNEIDAKVQEFRKQFQSDDAFKQALAQRGWTTMAALQKDVRNDLTVSKLMDADAATQPVVTDKDARGRTWALIERKAFSMNACKLLAQMSIISFCVT